MDEATPPRLKCLNLISLERPTNRIAEQSAAHPVLKRGASLRGNDRAGIPAFFFRLCVSGTEKRVLRLFLGIRAFHGLCMERTGEMASGSGGMHFRNRSDRSILVPSNPCVS